MTSSKHQAYTVTDYNRRHWVRHSDRIVAAISLSPTRSYLFPLCTPAGITVLNESPPDHLFHQGIRVAQDFLNGHNFWAPGLAGRAMHRQIRYKIDEAVDENGVTLTEHLAWVTEAGQHIMGETRTVRFEAWEAFHFVEVTSIWHATYDEIYVSPTKEGGLGMRVHWQLETSNGGQIRSSAGGTGESEVFDSHAEWIEVSGLVGDQPVGVVMMPHPSMTSVPWFSRDYGLHLYSPQRHQPLHLGIDETTTLRVAFATYDGVCDGSQAKRAWERYAQ